MYASKPMEYRLVETHSVPGRKRNSKRDTNIVNKFLLINKFHHINSGLSIAVSTSGKSTLISYFNIFYIKNLLFQYSLSQPLVSDWIDSNPQNYFLQEKKWWICVAVRRALFCFKSSPSYITHCVKAPSASPAQAPGAAGELHFTTPHFIGLMGSLSDLI